MFGTDSVLVHERFLGEADVEDLARCARLRRERGEFVPARIGGALSVRRDEHIRGDLSCWLTEPLEPAEKRLFQRLEELRLALNREHFLGLFDLEMHYAWYPPGAGYSRHIDTPLGSDARRVSVIAYLNEHWGEDDGGELKLMLADGTRTIRPEGGRLVAFLSAGLEHEVLACRRDRLSLTGWFRVRA